MMNPTQAGIGLVRIGASDFVPANLEDDLRGKDVYAAEGRRAEDYASPPYGGDTGRAADRLDMGGYGPHGR